jgi:hypothetical protein
MKLTRLLLLLALMVSMLAAPEAFGAKAKRSSLRHSRIRAKNEALMCDWFTITCADGRTDDCCGDVNSCLAYCDSFCNNGLRCVYQGNAT